MESKKKVVHIIPTLERGGSEMSQLRMLPLISDEIESTFVTLRDGGPLQNNFEKAGIKVYCIHQRNLLDIAAYIRIIHTLRGIAPDLIITHLILADIIGRFFVQFFFPCKLISSVATTYNFPQYWSARFFERTTKYLATGYMANAEIVKKTYVERFGVPEKKIAVIPTGMDTEAFLRTQPNDNLHQTLNIKSGDTVIICVANLHINKGHIYLLEAFEKVSETYPHLKLLLVGDGQERKNLEVYRGKLKAKNHIYFLGKRSDVPELLALSHIFVLPTFFEGMCNAIMEAMASGLAVISSDIPENHELITPGKNGLLCPIKNSNSLAQSIERLIQNPTLAKALGKNAQESVHARYNLKKSAERWKSYFLLMSQK